ncbi:hypothetical protein [Microlunatus parietis]|uniref:Uncharacterized protein n=1 Tax=Microlunatus parietis TaxID=682979 RepID=A0A7Y9I8W2_9ACTN|nr:hypothetical protein [Microlunatus parietis]NYE72096.1 hypothetical protein [Microlunatus parietis]
MWPDTPLGEHQRYAYRITDVATRQELEGRDLFTGAGAPVDPDRALSELAGFLTAAGDARQYALDHPGNTPENEGLFPAWVADAARENADPLTVLSELAEHDPPEPEPEPVEWRWISVVFLQGSEADEVLDLIDAEGVDAAIEHLKGFDYGDETTQAALENGYVYDEPPTGARDQVVNDGGYALTYNPFAGDVGLLREHSTPPQDALDESGVVSAREATAGIGALEHTSAPAPRAEKAEAPRTGPPRAGARRAPDASWFTHPDIAAAKQARGLSR